ncbi:uncharacterized protein LOC100679748 [Nasonia vitripennis]|uniref:Uncharacterized protein n=1 Tax=Nasonia vitripennis TaxID=7425 RepID=A0A7M7GMB3_NASVI|nr:uncharacterized protein LOC100679748 [Nasonia vitripennis]
MIDDRDGASTNTSGGLRRKRRGEVRCGGARANAASVPQLQSGPRPPTRCLYSRATMKNQEDSSDLSVEIIAEFQVANNNASLPAEPKNEAEDAAKPAALKEDITLYLSTITAIGSIFIALRLFIIRLQNFPNYVKFARKMSSRKHGTASTDPALSSFRPNCHQAELRTGKIRRINVNKCPMKKKRRKLKLHMFKCEHLAKLLLLEAYASTTQREEEEIFQTITVQEGLGIGRLMLKMMNHDEQAAVEELGRKTVDFMKHIIVEIENHYVRNGFKL